MAASGPEQWRLLPFLHRRRVTRLDQSAGKVHGLDHDPDTQGTQHFLDRPRHLLGQPLLHLQAPSERFDDPRRFESPTIRPSGMYAICALPKNGSR